MLKPNGNKYELTKELVYKECVVPIGFKTDGLSYKLRLLALFVNKFDPRYVVAAIVHDYLCEQELYEIADLYFEELLPEDWRKSIMVKAVKFYHRSKYG